MVQLVHHHQRLDDEATVVRPSERLLLPRSGVLLPLRQVSYSAPIVKHRLAPRFAVSRAGCAPQESLEPAQPCSER